MQPALLVGRDLKMRWLLRQWLRASVFLLFSAIEAAAQRDAAVDRDHLPGDVLRLLGAEPRHRAPNILHRLFAPKWNRGAHRCLEGGARFRIATAQRRPEVFPHLGIDEAGRDRIDADALGPELQRAGLAV